MFEFLRHIELRRDTVQDWKEYPFCIPAIMALERLEFDPAVTFLVGENGSGKSTLIEAIAIKAGYNAEGGTKNFTSANRPSESDLHEHLWLARGARREKAGFFLRAETMFNVFTEAERGGYSSWAALHEKSHGEAFLWVAMHKFRDKGLYILDEPESALSFDSCLSLLAILSDLVANGSQILLATHSPVLAALPNATLLQLSGSGIEPVDYDDADLVTSWRTFLAAPQRYLRHLT
jgi:predicted ATPase